MIKTKYSKVKALPLKHLNVPTIKDITEDIYDLMLEYTWRLTQNEELAYEILHQSLFKYANHIERNPEKTVSGGLFVLVTRSVLSDYYSSNNKQHNVETYDVIDDRSEAGHKYEEELKIIAIDKALQTLSEYQRELYLFSLTTKKIELARALDVNIQKINKELDGITNYIKEYVKIMI